MPDAPDLSEEAKKIAQAAFSVFKDSLTGFVERQDVDEFARERVEQYTQEWWAAKTATTDEDRAEHEQNLKHLVAQARGEARRLQIAISQEAEDTVGRVLETVGGMILKVLPAVIAAL